MTECIEAKTTTKVFGYHQVRLKGKRWRAHRWAWELINGPIPEGLVVDHICRNRACVAIDHLRVMTQQENIMAGEHNIDNRSHCNQGHLFEGNIMVRKNGKRECSECNRVRSRTNYAKKKAGA
jgi:hypothetical protein